MRILFVKPGIRVVPSRKQLKINTMNISYFKETTVKKSIRNISFADVMECMQEEPGRAKAGLLAKRLKGA
ncbi:MAG TPA: hypothetical protein DCE74_10760, partial [Porphyromonadaceae bacterium]|nr:hypothetical protein [Porphyromonadaceae bacterium]